MQGSKLTTLDCLYAYAIWMKPNKDINKTSSFSDKHRQRIINWIDSTGGLCAAFDFTTKGILQVRNRSSFFRSNK
jgi:hypothetical protein